MTQRSQETIEKNIKEVLEEYVQPAVAMHGGYINFVNFTDGHLVLELSGSCSGCAGSTMTLKFGVESMMKELVPEVTSIEAFDDPFSNADPFYTDSFFDDTFDYDSDHRGNHDSSN